MTNEMKIEKHVADCGILIKDCKICKKWHEDNPGKTALDLRVKLDLFFLEIDYPSGRESWNTNTL